MKAIILFFLLLGTLALGAGQTVHMCSEEGGCAYTGALNAYGNTTTGNVAIKPDTSVEVQYVARTCTNSTGCADTNDGLTWGTAKLTIQAAVNALSSCSYSAATFDHCGVVYIGAGSFPDTLTIDSPYVKLVAVAPGTTYLNPTITTGCVIDWTSTPFNSAPYESDTGGIWGLIIDGTNASAGTCGIRGHDIGAFHLHGKIINFSGSGSSGLWEDATSEFDERWDVYLRLGNDMTCWKVTGNRTGFSATTFGYGNYRLWCNPAAGGTFVTSTGQSGTPTFFQYSYLQLIGNEASGETGISLDGYSQWDSNVLDIHLEGESTSIDVASGGDFEGNGIVTTNGVASSGAGTYQVMTAQHGLFWGPDGTAANPAYSFESKENSGLFLNGSVPALSHNGAESAQFGTGSAVLASSSLCLGGISTYSCLSSPSTGHTWTFPSVTGTLALSGANGVSAGTVSISAATTGSHSFGAAYSTAPSCSVTPTSNLGTTTYWISTLSTTTLTITLSASATATFDFTCSPAVN